MKFQSFRFYSQTIAIFIKRALARARVADFPKICILAAALFSTLTPFATMADSKLVITSKTPMAEGRFQTIGIAGNEIAPYLVPAYYDWLDQHFDIMQVYSPWFDDITASYANGFVYKNLYAIYDCRLSTDPANDPVEPDAVNLHRNLIQFIQELRLIVIQPLCV